MKIENIKNFVRGWFVGDFEPSLYKTQDVEVAVQNFSKGQYEQSHCHKIATEITVIIKGVARTRSGILNEGDILVIPPGEYTDFEALEDVTTLVVKLPGALNDKYLESESA